MTKLNIDVKEQLLKANDLLADRLRKEWRDKGILAINMLSSPGAGKTSLLERILPLLRDRYRILVLEGDVETDRDARRIREKGVDAVQLTTGGTCHLEAFMIMQAWEKVRDNPWDIIFIENIGNLICPAGFDLGEHIRMVLLSVPEGDDKPAKYPKAFRSSHWFVLTKMDLLDYFDFDPRRAEEEARKLKPDIRVFHTSARTGEGVEELVSAIEEELSRIRASAS